MTLSFVLSLRDVRRNDIAAAGGKGANLGELTHAALPVPPGFVVTTAAYDRFVADNGLNNTIIQMSDKEGGGAIREAFQGADIPTDISTAIVMAYMALGQGAVAVRSSATAEDLPGAAFAGQQDSFLNVLTTEALLAAVKSCWASLWNDRAIAYRARQGIDRKTVKLAVVVQRMVPADAAGVMFTANPITGERHTIIIDANPGLGEAVVSGLVTPDHFVLRKQTLGWKIAARRPGRREVMVRAQADGGTEQVTGMAVDAPSVSNAILRRLARTGTRIERLFGTPQDVEWAVSKHRLYIVQSRPMTALPEPPPHPGRMVPTIAAIFTDMFPIRPYPLDFTTWIPAASAGAVKPIFGILGIAIPPLQNMFISEDAVVIRFSGKLELRPTLRMLLAPARIVWLAFRYNPHHWQDDPLMAQAHARVREIEQRDRQQLSWGELLTVVQETLALPLPLAGMMRRRYLPRTLFAVGCLKLELGLLGKGKHLGVLLSGPESMTSAANRGIEDLAGRVRVDPVLTATFAAHTPDRLRTVLEGQPAGHAFLAELSAFLERYGHREAMLSSVLQPTWKDAPEVVLGLIKGAAATAQTREAGPAAWETARDEVLTHPVLRIAPFRAVFLTTLRTARCLWHIRENTHFNATRVMPILRRTFLEMGERLRAAGATDTPEDIFHLTWQELERLGATWPPPKQTIAALRAAVERRRDRRRQLESTPLIDPRLFRKSAARGNVLLEGMPGSPGVAEGAVRIIRSVSEFDNLRAGEVLVAHYTNPAWTPLFQRAAAVVVDGGAAASHAAIVAREYGIPAVMGTIDGTTRLTDGQMVRVDGSEGTVSAAKTV